MDALSSRSGIIEVRTDIAKYEGYLLAEPGFEMTEEEVRGICNDYGYGLRAYKATTTAEIRWEDLGAK